MRQQFPFYKSFDDALEDLTDNQLAKYVRALLDVQFLRVKIEDIKFNDKILNIVWKSQKHSMSKSINGFLDGQKRESIKKPYFGVYGDDFGVPYEGVREGIQTPKLQGKGECKEQGKEQGKEQVECSGVTTRSCDVSFNIAEYLHQKILSINPSLKKPNINTWAKDIELAMRIDGRTETELVNCINWIYTPKGQFWQKNILSGKKLREQFDKMNMQVISTQPTYQEKQELKKQDEEKDNIRIYANFLSKQGLSAEQVEQRIKEEYAS